MVNRLDSGVSLLGSLQNEALMIQKQTSKSLISIKDQYRKQRLLDKKLRNAGVIGKRSLLKNFILRNGLMDD